MEELQQHLFALELIIALRLAMDPPEITQQIIGAVRAGLADASAAEAEVRQMALRILGAAT